MKTTKQQISSDLIEAFEGWSQSYTHALYEADGENRDSNEAQRMVMAAAMEYPLLKIFADHPVRTTVENRLPFVTDHLELVSGSWSSGVTVSHTYYRARPKGTQRIFEGDDGWSPDAVAVLLPIVTRIHAAFDHACILFIPRRQCRHRWDMIREYGFMLPRHDSPDCYADLEGGIAAAYEWKRHVLEVAGRFTDDRLFPSAVQPMKQLRTGDDLEIRNLGTASHVEL